MTLPLWAKPGTLVECIDDAWSDVLAGESRGPYPVAGGRYTVMVSTVDPEGIGFLVFAERSITPDYYEVSGFRPLTLLERDVEIVKRGLKGASGMQRQPELVW